MKLKTQINHQCKQLKLHSIAEKVQVMADQAATDGSSYLQFVSTLLEANVAAGSIRADLDPATVLRALGGLLHLNPTADWRAQTDSLTDLLWTGMRA